MILADTEIAEGNRLLPSDSPSQSDLELIAAVNGGDADAFEDLYRRHRDWVARVACRYTRDEDLALDVLQEVFIYFLGKFPGFQLRCELRTFLFPAIRNLALNIRRRSDRYVEASDSIAELPAKPAAPGNDDLIALVQTLSEAQREVLLLRFVDGFDLAEIAEALEIPLGTVKSRLHNALGALERDPRTKQFFGE